MGRGKSGNILIIGSANCAKTFLLRPLELLFGTFCTPSNTKYAWIGLDGKEIIFWNDFWCSNELISWETFFVLLEGEVVHFSLSKNHFSKNLLACL